MTDLAERLDALASRNDEPLPSANPVYSDEEALSRFEEHLASGFGPPEAAALVGRTGRYMRGFRSPKSERYDPDHHLRFEEIMAPEGEHRQALVEHARAALVKAASNGNVRAIEKILMAYDADFQFLRPASFSGEVNIENFVQLMPGIPTEMLQQLKQALLESKQKELPVIDA